MSEQAGKLLTVQEIAKYLRVKPSTVYEWAKNGKMPAAKVGRLWRFDREKVEAWVQNGGLKGPRPFFNQNELR